MKKLVSPVSLITAPCHLFLLLFDVTMLKMVRKSVKLHKENPAGCAGEGKQSKGNQEKRKGRFFPPIAYCDEVTRRRCGGRLNNITNPIAMHTYTNIIYIYIAGDLI